MPNTTTRAGGVFLPIIGSLSLSYRPKKRREREAAAAR
jgi:hypothetical protein